MAERRSTAEKEAAEVSALKVRDGFHGTYRVAAASEWDEGYTVEIRNLIHPNNSCACTDTVFLCTAAKTDPASAICREE